MRLSLNYKFYQKGKLNSNLKGGGGVCFPNTRLQTVPKEKSLNVPPPILLLETL